MAAGPRKIVTYRETTYIEGGRAAPRPLDLIAAAAIIANPWAGRGFVEDLKPEIDAVAPVLGELLTAEILRLTGGGEAVEGYGKAAVVGTSGEVEHASASWSWPKPMEPDSSSARRPVLRRPVPLTGCRPSSPARLRTCGRLQPAASSATS